MKVRRLGAVNFAKFTAFNSVLGAALQLLSLNVFGAALAIIAAAGAGLVGVVLFGYCSKLAFIDGLDLQVDVPDGFLSTPGGWVKVRRQGGVNSGKIAGLMLFLIGIPFGLLAFAVVAFGAALISIFYAPAATWGLGLALAAILLVPISFGAVGFLFGVALAGSGNWIRGFKLIDGLDVKVGLPQKFSKTPTGEPYAWVKVRRFGCMNLAKINGLQDLALGALVFATVLLLEGTIAAAFPQYASVIALVGGIWAVVGVLVILAVVTYGFVSGLAIGVVANWALSQGYVEGLDLLVSLKPGGQWPPSATGKAIGAK